MYEYICKCDCGAVTITIKDQDYSMPRELFNTLYKGKNIKIEHEVNGCNYCINHWGIDLCACGSGEKYQECTEEYNVCGNTMQNIENKQINVKGGNALC